MRRSHGWQLSVLVALGLLARAAAAPANGPDPVLARFAEVDAEPVKTWIYVGTVTLTASPFHRIPGAFVASYAAKVFPYFGLNEAGRMQIDVSDDGLRQIAAGRPISFTGRAIRARDGAVHHLHGQAIPTGAASGKLTVTIHAGRGINLTFDSTYRLPAATAAVKASGTR